MKYTIATPLILITIISFLGSCKKDMDDPAPVDIHYDFSEVEKLLDDTVPSKFGGKCFAVICVDGKTAFSKGYGGYTGDTKQLIASCTKWLSAAVVMSLVDEGKIKLTDPVSKFLPVFTTYGKGDITIAQLFSHTSGFPGDSDQGYEKNNTLTLEKAVDSIAKNVDLINIPGAKFYYGGVSMQVAGRVCEVVSGKDWKTLFKEKITDPCGMSNTDFGTTNNPIIAGGGRSTPNDYIKFLYMIMNKGLTTEGVRVLSENAIALMEQSQIGNASVEYSPYPVLLINTPGIYGMGNWRDLTGANDILIEDSSPGLYGSHPWINRDKKVTGFIFTFILINGYLTTMKTSLTVRSLTRTIVN